MTTKRSFEMQELGQMLGRPEVLGPLLSAAPGFTRGLASMTGGVGLFAAGDMLRNGGRNMQALTRGPINSRGPAVPAAPSTAIRGLLKGPTSFPSQPGGLLKGPRPFPSRLAGGTGVPPTMPKFAARRGR